MNCPKCGKKFFRDYRDEVTYIEHLLEELLKLQMEKK